MSECITNTSLLSTNKFAVVIPKFPAVQFFAQKVKTPELSINATEIKNNQEIKGWLPANRLFYGDVIITFLLDEDLLSYSQLKDWLHVVTTSELDPGLAFTDITLFPLTNNNVINKKMVFEYAFPTNISSIEFDATRSEDIPLTVDVTFKFSVFKLL